MSHTAKVLSASLVIALLISSQSKSADPTIPPSSSGQLEPAASPANPVAEPSNPTQQPGSMGSNKMTTAKSFPSKTLVGLNVRNPQGEKLGIVDDLVVDLQTGKVVYVALSVGGVLGIGDRLFAVPYDEFKFNYGPNEKNFVLNVSKERLEGAPGFNKDQWPDFADPQWRNQIDTYYRNPAASAQQPVIDQSTTAPMH